MAMISKDKLNAILDGSRAMVALADLVASCTAEEREGIDDAHMFISAKSQLERVLASFHVYPLEEEPLAKFLSTDVETEAKSLAKNDGGHQHTVPIFAEYSWMLYVLRKPEKPPVVLAGMDDGEWELSLHYRGWQLVDTDVQSLIRAHRNIVGFISHLEPPVKKAGSAADDDKPEYVRQKLTRGYQVSDPCGRWSRNYRRQIFFAMFSEGVEVVTDDEQPQATDYVIAIKLNKDAARGEKGRFVVYGIGGSGNFVIECWDCRDDKWTQHDIKASSKDDLIKWVAEIDGRVYNAFDDIGVFLSGE